MPISVSPAAAQTNRPLRLWEVLRCEYRRLRPQCQALQGVDFDSPAGTDSEQLPKLFAIVGSWSSRPQSGSQAGEGGTLSPPPAAAPLSALCFSGGGIRSATFNLGVLRGLARLGLLDNFDYLSSVSGGGYIAGWLARWVHEEGGGGISKVSRQLASPPLDPTEPEPKEVVYLRRFSNYLTPRLGVLSADTWTMVAIVLRNLLLNWVVLLPILTAPLILPLLAVVPYEVRHPRALLLAAAILELTGLFFVSLLRASQGTADEKAQAADKKVQAPRWTRWYLQLGLLPRLAAVPLLLAAVAALFEGHIKTLPTLELYGYCAVWALALPLLALVVSVPLQQPLLHRKEAALGWEVLAVLFAGGLDALVYVALLRNWLPYLVRNSTLYAILGPSLVLGTMLLGRTVFVAMASISERWQSLESGDADREWWARWSAWTLICLVAWMAGSALVLCAPSLLANLSAQLGALASAVGFGGAAALLGKSPSTPANEERGKASLPKRVMLSLAAPLFAVALVLLLAWGSQQLLERIWPAHQAAPARPAAQPAQPPG
ncbi:MAG: patatin-like phospholipase family protein, partial [Acidobacteriota bacterium]|nr:patatin-like phospholipase family protein [Acidobacteriota bacterium]